MKYMTKYVFTAYVLWCDQVFLNQVLKYLKNNYYLGKRHPPYEKWSLKPEGLGSLLPSYW